MFLIRIDMASCEVRRQAGPQSSARWSCRSPRILFHQPIPLMWSTHSRREVVVVDNVTVALQLTNNRRQFEVTELPRAGPRIDERVRLEILQHLRFLAGVVAHRRSSSATGMSARFARFTGRIFLSMGSIAP